MIDNDKFHLKSRNIAGQNSEDDNSSTANEYHQSDDREPKEDETVKSENDELEEILDDTIKIEHPDRSGQDSAVTEIKQEEFNWDTFGKKTDHYSEGERQNLEDMYKETFKGIAEKDIIEGTIVQKTNREVVVNIGYKSEGIIPLSEFRYKPDIKVGDKIEVFVESLEDKNGQLVLSHKKARSIVAWDRVNNAHETGEVIKGFIKCRTRGGMIVDLLGIEAFLPGSQIDVKPVRDYDFYVGKTMDFKVVKISNEFKNIVVSHKALVEDELKKQRADFMSKIEKGQILEGVVKNITNYGVFVDLGGIDGLIHISDLVWGRPKNPEEVVKLDEKINVVILDFDQERKRIALGLKQLQPHPWDTLDPDLKTGDKIKGTIVSVADYGAFLEIKNGVEGLIHVSEMSWSQYLRTANEFVKVGDEIEVVILALDREERKMSLSMKQLKSDPWANIEEKYPIGTQHISTVRNLTDFGIFAELEEGIDGLIHISDLSWLKKFKHPSEFTQIGKKIEVKILGIDKENRRLSLGHKQIGENPWDVFETVFTVNSVHKGTVARFEEKNAIIILPYGVEAFAQTKHLIKEDKTHAKTNETLDFKVIEFLRESKRINVSHSKVWQDKLEEEKLTKDLEKKATKPKKSTKKDKIPSTSAQAKTQTDEVESASVAESTKEEQEIKEVESKNQDKIEDKKNKKEETSKNTVIKDESTTDEVQPIKTEQDTNDN